MKNDPQYRWYPKRKDGEPDLNPWWALFYRRLIIWLKRCYWFCNRRGAQALYRERMHLATPIYQAVPETLTQEARARLTKIARILGDGSPYRFTPAQEKRRAELSEQLITEVIQELAEERAQQH